MTDLHTKRGTIAYILNQNKDTLFNLINNNEINKARQKAIELISDDSITDKKAVITATNVFKKSKDNLFLSSLITYMTGLKVS